MTTTTQLIHRAVRYEQPTAVIRANVELGRIPLWLPLAYRAIHEYLTAHGIDVAGPPFARYTFEGVGADKAGVEAGFPVGRAIVGDDYVVASTLPHGPVGIAMHWGSYDSIARTYDAVRDWLKLHGYEQSGPMWEVYLTDPDTHPDPASWRTEVVVPYRAL